MIHHAGRFGQVINDLPVITGPREIPGDGADRPAVVGKGNAVVIRAFSVLVPQPRSEPGAIGNIPKQTRREEERAIVQEVAEGVVIQEISEQAKGDILTEWATRVEASAVVIVRPVLAVHLIVGGE
ncbi:MAG: hypothetical protein EOO39_49965 [Cytophagaceae bacterium]|nr:MAG: hypothetical protein EOO39_49965 [Cytophagaceae bacterium]